MQSNHAFLFVSLADAMDISGGAQPPASTFKEKLEPGYVRFVQIRDFETDAHLTYIKREDKWRYCTEEDVLIARYGASVGRVCRGVAGAYNVALVKVVPKAGEREYLYHLLRSDFFQGPIAAMSGRSAQAGFNKGDLAAIQVPLPSRAEQRRIASFLDAFERRIALLRNTNATLESIAQALFKSWFIDFDPVRAKAEGREPEGMDAATAALFPAEFEASALGVIPKGWTVEPIGELIEALGGSTPDTKNGDFWEPAAHHWTSPKDLSGATAPVLLDTERKVSDAGLAKISSGLLPAGTLLMSSRAPIGYLSLTQIPVAINQGYIAMPPGGTLPPVYAYFWCQANMDAIKGRANGSTFMEISKKAFRPILALLPPKGLIASFVSTAALLFERITANEQQARALAETRDTLLPRLISGKLRLPEAQELAEAV